MEQIRHYEWAQSKLDEITQTRSQERHEVQRVLELTDFSGNRADRRAAAKQARKQAKKVKA